MDAYRIEVFDSSSPTPRLRWFDNEGRMVHRVLDRTAIDEFIAAVEQKYQVLGADLADLGGMLYRWLDGPTERWLAAAREKQRPIGVHLDCDGRLRHLPWELIHDGGFLAVSAGQPIWPVRCASPRNGAPTPVANRPLRVLFMASFPVDVAPVLDFEGEEAMILAAAANLVEVVVEENGSLEGLRSVVTMFGDGYFDVLHVSGHATLGPTVPRFVLENEIGMRDDATAAEIAEALGHSWPPLVFVSGCHTGRASGEGELASMAEALVQAGAPAVLGWALPVGDHAASQLAAVLYHGLATGGRRDAAVTAARRALFTSKSPYWHLLRLYADRTPLGPLVTPPAQKGRVKLRARPVSELFLGPSGEVKVASNEGFVGRRRELQRCLRALRPVGSAVGPQLLILHGMGGLGKSTLAARLLDRMRTTHPKQAVWVGQIDENEICKLTDRVTLDAASHLSINKLLTEPGLTLEERIRFILDGPLTDVACVFVFDDFEHGNLDDDGNGGYVCTPAALEVVTALATAIARTGSQSRVIITSRHDFPLPPGVAAQRESLSALRGADLEKKLQLTANLGSSSALAPAVRRHAIDAAAGIPRLVERIDRLISDPGTDHEQILGTIDATAVEYREELLAEKLLAAQQPETRRMLALAAIYEIPVPVAATAALVAGGAVSSSLARAVAVGLIDTGPHPTSGEHRYLVSNLLKPLLGGIAERLTDKDRVAAFGLGARALYELWVVPDGQ